MLEVLHRQLVLNHIFLPSHNRINHILFTVLQLCAVGPPCHVAASVRRRLDCTAQLTIAAKLDLTVHYVLSCVDNGWRSWGREHLEKTFNHSQTQGSAIASHISKLTVQQYGDALLYLTHKLPHVVCLHRAHIFSLHHIPNHCKCLDTVFSKFPPHLSRDLITVFVSYDWEVGRVACHCAGEVQGSTIVSGHLISREQNLWKNCNKEIRSTTVQCHI